jgi:hypothetical protein
MPPTPSRASIFFRQIEDIGQSAAYDRLADLAKESAKTEENEWREFKGGGFLGKLKTASTKQKQETDRRLKEIWSECLGAFANSAGGILIWGIRAPNKIAEKIDLVPDAIALRDRLSEVANEAVDPPVLGIQVMAVTRKASPPGFVVCHIPASDFSPHRSVWAKREYYLRIQDGNRPVPTAVLRRMFYPRDLSAVVPIARAFITLGNDQCYHLQLSIGLRNRGLASAEDVAIHFIPLEQKCETYYDTNRWSEELLPDGFYFRARTTIHPDETLPWLSNCTSDVRDWTEWDRTLGFKIRIFARNTPARAFVLLFTAAELAAQPNTAIIREAAPEE